MKNKQSIVCLVIFFIVILFFIGLIYVNIEKEKELLPQQLISEEKIKELRERMSIQRQIIELDKIYQQTGLQPPSPEEINKQLEELDKLHSQLP